MKKFNKLIGDYGEHLGAEHLREQGYDIIEKNFRCSFGEIDIIAKENNLLCFIEVKTRYGNKYGYPLDSIDWKKQKKLYNLAEFYLMKNKISNINCRFDILDIRLDLNRNSRNIFLIKDAFRLY